MCSLISFFPYLSSVPTVFTALYIISLAEPFSTSYILSVLAVLMLSHCLYPYLDVSVFTVVELQYTPNLYIISFMAVQGQG